MRRSRARGAERERSADGIDEIYAPADDAALFDHLARSSREIFLAARSLVRERGAAQTEEMDEYMDTSLTAVMDVYYTDGLAIRTCDALGAVEVATVAGAAETLVYATTRSRAHSPLAYEPGDWEQRVLKLAERERAGRLVS